MAFQHRLAQAVAVAGRSGVVIAGSIAFDAQQIAARLFGVHHGQIDEETGNADLRLNLQAQLRELLGQRLVYIFFQRRLQIAPADARHGQIAGGRVVEEDLERSHALALAAFQINIVCRDGREHLAALLGTRDQHVQAALATIGADGAKAHGQIALGIARIGHRDKDHIALVALHVFQVLDEEGFVGVGNKERLGLGLLAAQQFQLILNGDFLLQRKRGHAKTELRRLQCVGHDGVGNGLGFQAVDARAAAVKAALGQMVKAQTHARAGRVGAGHDEQAAAVELLVGHRNQRLVAAAVMPAQHELGHALGQAQAQNAFHIGSAGDQLIFVLVVILILFAGHAREKARGRQLAVIAHHHQLLAAGDGAQRIHGFDLAGLVNHQQVELDSAGLQKLRHRKRAHHEHGLDGLHSLARQLEQLAQRHMAAFAGNLAIEHAKRPNARRRARYLLIMR